MNRWTKVFGWTMFFIELASLIIAVMIYVYTSDFWVLIGAICFAAALSVNRKSLENGSYPNKRVEEAVIRYDELH